MFIVTDAVTGNSVFVAPRHVVAVFEVVEGEHKGKTGVNLINGSVLAKESVLEIVAHVNNKD